jgi:1-acyl-sn-glycerol-3-phosphate acyltransferase
MGEFDGFWRAIRVVARVLFTCVLGWSVDVQGRDHLPEGGAVLAFNHHGYVDVVFVAWVPVIEERRPVRFLAKAELFRHWATGWLVRAAHAVHVERRAAGGTSRAEAYQAAVQSLRDGDLVAVAPEQTISESYELLPFKPGVARMAIEAGVPIVPAIGWGSQRAVPKGRRIRPRRGLPIVIRYCEPVVPRPREGVTALTARLQASMASALEEVQRAYPDTPTPGDDWWAPARLGGSAPDHAQVVAAHQARFRARRSRDGGGGVAS